VTDPPLAPSIAAGESFDFAWAMMSSVRASAARRFSRAAAVLFCGRGGAVSRIRSACSMRLRRASSESRSTGTIPVCGGSRRKGNRSRVFVNATITHYPAIDQDAQEITIDDLTTKRPVTIRLSSDSRVKKMPAMRSGGPAGGGQPHGPPSSARPFTIAQMLERIPAGSFDDFRVGGGVMVTSTRGATPGKVTAILIVANVDGLIQFAQMQSGSGANPLEALGRMHGGMMGGPGGFNLPAMIP